MNNKYYIVGIVIIAVIIGGLVWWRSDSGAGMATGDSASVGTTPPAGGQPIAPGVYGSSSPTTSSTSPSGSQTPQTVTVAYTSQGFSPATVTVREGDTVTWVNRSGNPMVIASDPHPLHNGYDGTSRSTHCAAGYSGPMPFDECNPADTFSFTFTKTGSWGYHNHLNQSQGGTVVVQ